MQKLAFFTLKNPVKDLETATSSSSKKPSTSFENFLIRIVAYVALAISIITAICSAIGGILHGACKSIINAVVKVESTEKQWYSVGEYLGYAAVAALLLVTGKSSRYSVCMIMAVLCFSVFVLGHVLYFAAHLNGGLTKNATFLIEGFLLIWKSKKLRVKK